MSGWSDPGIFLRTSHAIAGQASAFRSPGGRGSTWRLRGLRHRQTRTPTQLRNSAGDQYEHNSKGQTLIRFEWLVDCSCHTPLVLANSRDQRGTVRYQILSIQKIFHYFMHMRAKNNIGILDLFPSEFSSTRGVCTLGTCAEITIFEDCFELLAVACHPLRTVLD